MTKKPSDINKYYKLESYDKWSGIVKQLREALRRAESRCGYCFAIGCDYCTKCPMYKAKVCGYNFEDDSLDDKRGYKHRKFINKLSDLIDLGCEIKNAVEHDFGGEYDVRDSYKRD